MKNYINMGLVHAMAYPEAANDEKIYLSTLEETINDPYFNVVEIIPPFNEGMYRTVADMVKNAKMDWVYCATPVQYQNDLDLNSEDAAVVNKAIELLKQEIENAARLGIKKVQICSGKQIQEIRRRPYIRDILINSLKTCCKHAKSADVQLVLEIFDFDIEKKRFLGHSVDALVVAQEVRKEYENFGLLQDLSHIPIMYETSYPALATVEQYLTHVHIGNCVLKDKTHFRFGDTHPMFGIDGGEIDTEELTVFLKSLFAIGYLAEGKKSNISFEIKSWHNENPKEVIGKAKETMQKAWEAIS